MLLTIMYHHINSDKYSNDIEVMKKHFKYIANNFSVVTPCDKLSTKKTDICLTFDDAYYDFYHFVYPLLKEFNLKAILAVPIKFILDETTIKPNLRLSLKHDENYQFENYKKYATFCTYKELKEMSDSGYVTIASHSYSHINLKEKNVDLELELIKSKEILEEKLNRKIESFIFPFGKYSTKINELAKKEYKYLFRIGNAINRDFRGIDGVIYRVNGDGLKDYKEIFSIKNRILFYLKYLIKYITNITPKIQTKKIKK